VARESKEGQALKSPIPAWGWVFAVAWGMIPVLTLGGAIPGAIGFGGAAGCVGVAREPSLPVPARVGICAAITVGCWVLVILVVGLAMLTNR